MYYNGSLVSSNSSGTWFTGASKTFQMLRGDYWGGGPEMGELLIFPSASSSDQISTIYKSQKSTSMNASGVTISATGTPSFPNSRPQQRVPPSVRFPFEP
jgi:hypothetical protein